MIGAGNMDKKNISNKTEYVMHGKGIDGSDFDAIFCTEWASSALSASSNWIAVESIATSKLTEMSRAICYAH